MRHVLIALSAALLVSSAAAAQPRPDRPPPPQPGWGGPGDHRPGPDRPGPGGDYRPGPGHGPGWRPDRPPSHWGNRGERAWTRHVRACQARYRSYNPRTDRYLVRPGVTARCRL